MDKKTLALFFKELSEDYPTFSPTQVSISRKGDLKIGSQKKALCSLSDFFAHVARMVGSVPNAKNGLVKKFMYGELGFGPLFSDIDIFVECLKPMGVAITDA